MFQEIIIDSEVLHFKLIVFLCWPNKDEYTCTQETVWCLSDEHFDQRLILLAYLKTTLEFIQRALKEETELTRNKLEINGHKCYNTTAKVLVSLRHSCQ